MNNKIKSIAGLKVAFLGPNDTYTHIAARSKFGKNAVYVPMNTFQVCKRVYQKDVDVGVLPVENNSAGFVEITLDAIYATADVKVVDEIYLPIHHQLLSKSESLNTIRQIYSHAQAFIQCRKTLEQIEQRLGRTFKRLTVESTALGAEFAAHERDAAAIASEEVASRLKLNILARNIEDRNDNTTRFWVLSLGKNPKPSGYDRTAFLLELEHRPGTLGKLLNLFAGRNLNLSWIQTRPIGAEKRSGRWEYAFFLEYEGHIRSKALAAVYNLLKTEKIGIQRTGSSARLLGSYPNRIRQHTARLHRKM